MSDLSETVARLRELEQQATKGGWTALTMFPNRCEVAASVMDTLDTTVCRVSTGKMQADAELIAAMRNALPDLLHRLARLEQERGELAWRLTDLLKERDALKSYAALGKTVREYHVSIRGARMFLQLHHVDTAGLDSIGKAIDAFPSLPDLLAAAELTCRPDLVWVTRDEAEPPIGVEPSSTVGLVSGPHDSVEGVSECPPSQPSMAGGSTSIPAPVAPPEPRWTAATPVGCVVCGHQRHKKGRCDVAIGVDDRGGDSMCACQFESEHAQVAAPKPSRWKAEDVREVIHKMEQDLLGVADELDILRMLRAYADLL